METVRQALKEAKEFLAVNGVLNPLLDAEVLLAFTLKKSRGEIFKDINSPLPQGVLKRYRALLARRAKGEPVAYITGEKEFMSLTFKVNSNVLIPRPETEILVEEAIKILKKKPLPLTVADVCTGSGAIGISLAVFLPGVKVYATDISSGAMEVARANAQNMGVADKIEFIEGDLLSPFFGGTGKITFDAVVANPPYIKTVDLAALPREVKFEPQIALDGGFKGLKFYYELAHQAPLLLSHDGFVLFEIGWDQGNMVKEILLAKGFKDIKIFKDYAGLDRVVYARV